MAEDIEMKPEETGKKPEDKPKDAESASDSKEKEKEKAPEPPTPLAEIKTNILLIERAVSTLEPRFALRVLRRLAALRKRVDETVLRNAVDEIWVKDSPVKSELLSWIPSSPKATQEMQVDSSQPRKPATKDTTEPLPEAEIYIRLLLIHHLLKDPKNYEKGIDLATKTAHKMLALNRRSMDPIAAKVWYAVERAYELGGNLEDVRPLFLSAHKTAALRHDDETLASLTNRLLHSYLASSLYSQASILVAKTTFPSSASNPQFARFHYFLGRIHAVQLNYSESHLNLQQAIRRAPPAKQAPGFWQAVHKLNVVVQMLMGDIPDRSIFRDPVLEKALSSYFEIVRAVRTGSLEQFQSVLAKHAKVFEEDKTYTLISRLRQNVIKTGIKKLSLSYSRISLKDICLKLSLDSEEDAEYIVGKAIRDGVIEGRTVIVHDKGWMECSGVKGGYGIEVADIFQRRIGYCLELHNESVKAMRYPLNAHKRELADAEGAREREKELVKELEENGGDVDDDMGGDF